MKKQILSFWRDVLLATGMLVLIVVVGVLASGCAVNKKHDKVANLIIDTAKVATIKCVFEPFIEHSEIKDDGEADITAGNGISISPYDYLPCEHIWVREESADSTFSKSEPYGVVLTSTATSSIFINRCGVDYSYTPLVCVRCFQKISKVHKTDYGECGSGSLLNTFRIDTVALVRPASKRHE